MVTLIENPDPLLHSSLYKSVKHLVIVLPLILVKFAMTYQIMNAMQYLLPHHHPCFIWHGMAMSMDLGQINMFMYSCALEILLDD